MAIRTAPAGPKFAALAPKAASVGPDSALAHRYCQGVGLELGAGAHNPFSLPGALNVAPFSDDPENPEYEDFVTYKKCQIEACGRYAVIDIPCAADDIQVPDSSQDYVVSSHVVEHIPDLIGAFVEWNRVLKADGIVVMIFPKRGEAELDAIRDITALSHFIEDFAHQRDADTHPFDGVEPRRRGHYHVFTLRSMLELIEWCNRNLGLNWQIEAVEETDSKIGNGHTVVARYLGPLSERAVRLRVASSALPVPINPGVATPTDDTQAMKAGLADIEQSAGWRRWLLPSDSRRRRVYTALRSKLVRFVAGS